MRTRQLGPNSKFISLNNLITEGGQHGTIMVGMILSITASTDQTQITQRTYNATRGQMSTVRHSRKITIMCLCSPPGQNTALILQGNGLSPRLFEDTETRDNGCIRKFRCYTLIMSNFFNHLLSNHLILLIYLFRSWCYRWVGEIIWC